MINVVEQLFKYRNQRPEAKLGEQLYAIPQKEDKMIKGQVYYYENPDSRLRTSVDFKKEVCIELRYEHMQLLVPKEYKALQESRTKVQTLIGKGYIRPFCLMLNGRFIPWKYIELICVTEKYYMLVSGMTQAIFDEYFFGVLRSINMIRLPEDITYTDNANGNSPVTDRTIFAFDKTGALVPDGDAAYLIESDDSDLQISVGTPENQIFTISDNLRYSYFPEYVFSFPATTVESESEEPEPDPEPNPDEPEPDPDEPIEPDPDEPVDPEPEPEPTPAEVFYTYDGNVEISVLGSMCRIYGAENTCHVRTFFNTKGTPNYDHMHKVSFNSVRSDIIRTLLGDASFPYMELLKEKFNVPFTTAKEWALNRKEGLDYIAQYDSRLFNEIYKKEKKFIVREVDYAWILTHLDEDGNLRIPRRFTLHHNFYILVFRNGELFANNGMSYYDGPDFIMPIDGLHDGDAIEIWYFIGAKTYEYDMNLDVNEPYLPLDQDFYYIQDDMALYCQETSRTNFYYPAKGLQNFKVDYTLQPVSEEDNRSIRVRLNNAWYYSRDLIMTSINRFAHKTVYITLNDGSEYANYYKIDLGTDFMYCNNYDRYMIFYNGRRLSFDQYRLVLPCDDGYPFYRYQIYIGKPMKNGDVIDVVYLPTYCMDVYDAATDGIASNGIIEVPKGSLWNALDNELYTFWVNGKKIPSSAIMPIDANKVQLMVDQESLEDLRVTLMLQYDSSYDELKERFNTYTSYWDQILTMIDPAVLLGIDRPELTDTEDPYFVRVFEMKALMKELVRDWYISNTYVDCTKPFYYKYREIDNTLIEDIQRDSAGIELLEVMDSNTADNLDVDRPYSD